MNISYQINRTKRQIDLPKNFQFRIQMFLIIINDQKHIHTFFLQKMGISNRTQGGEKLFSGILTWEKGNLVLNIQSFKMRRHLINIFWIKSTIDDSFSFCSVKKVVFFTQKIFNSFLNKIGFSCVWSAI